MINTSRAPIITQMCIGILVIEILSSVFMLGGCVVRRCSEVVVVQWVHICWGLLVVGHVGLIVVPILVG